MVSTILIIMPRRYSLYDAYVRFGYSGDPF